MGFRSDDDMRLLLSVLVLAAALNAAAAMAVDDGEDFFGDDGGADRCSEMTPLEEGVCAVLFDGRGCSGWKHVFRGEHGFGALPFEMRSEAESVLVKKGCVFYGYDFGWSKGRVVVVNADTANGDLADDFVGKSELGERVNSIACYCHVYQDRESGVYDIDPRTHSWRRINENPIGLKEYGSEVDDLLTDLTPDGGGDDDDDDLGLIPRVNNAP